MFRSEAHQRDLRNLAKERDAWEVVQSSLSKQEYKIFERVMDVLDKFGRNKKSECDHAKFKRLVGDPLKRIFWRERHADARVYGLRCVLVLFLKDAGKLTTSLRRALRRYVVPLLGSIRPDKPSLPRDNSLSPIMGTILDQLSCGRNYDFKVLPLEFLSGSDLARLETALGARLFSRSVSVNTQINNEAVSFDLTPIEAYACHFYVRKFNPSRKFTPDDPLVCPLHRELDTMNWKHLLHLQRSAPALGMLGGVYGIETIHYRTACDLKSRFSTQLGHCKYILEKTIRFGGLALIYNVVSRLPDIIKRLEEKDHSFETVGIILSRDDENAVKECLKRYWRDVGDGFLHEIPSNMSQSWKIRICTDLRDNGVEQLAKEEVLRDLDIEESELEFTDMYDLFGLHSNFSYKWIAEYQRHLSSFVAEFMGDKFLEECMANFRCDDEVQPAWGAYTPPISFSLAEKRRQRERRARFLAFLNYY